MSHKFTQKDYALIKSRQIRNWSIEAIVRNCDWSDTTVKRAMEAVNYRDYKLAVKRAHYKDNYKNGKGPIETAATTLSETPLSKPTINQSKGSLLFRLAQRVNSYSKGKR